MVIDVEKTVVLLTVTSTSDITSVVLCILEIIKIFVAEETILCIKKVLL